MSLKSLLNYYFWRLFYFLSPLFRDKIYLQLLFFMKVGYKLNLNNPITYNEKLQWLKLYYRRPEMVKMVDKYEAKQFAKSLIGEEHIIPTYGLWESFDEINFNSLPSQFVIKTTHDQGGVVICNNKELFDFNRARKIINSRLKRNHFYLSREWPYKDVEPRIIVEKHMCDENTNELSDFKFFCFNGVPKIMFLATERQSGEVKFDFFDMQFNHLDIMQIHEQSGRIFEKPKNFEKMFEIVKTLSKDLPHVRVDLYNINGEIYFGEFTFFHHGGIMPFHPEKWDYILGGWLNLPIESK